MHIVVVAHSLQISSDIAGFTSDKPSRMIEAIHVKLVAVHVVSLAGVQVKTDELIDVLGQAVK